jgi:glycosyltransferase involved in cell wall biosynthesis
MSNRQRVVYIVSEIHKSLAFEWVATALKDRYKLTFILLNPSHSPLERFLVQNEIEVKTIVYRGKKDYLRAFYQLLKYFLRTRPDIVHAHLFAAQITALPAASCALIKKRIYTRHTSNFHQVYSPKGVKYDLLSNRLATHIVSVSQATDRTLTGEGARMNKIRHIPHGFDLSVFDTGNANSIADVKARWNVSSGYPCIGVVARHIEWKGIQYIIPAFKQLLTTYPDAILVLANATGPYYHTLARQLEGVSKTNYVIIPFEEEIASLYGMFDVYVHTPVDELCEAFGQTYVEALAAGVPSIFTLSGIAAEFVTHKRNAWVVGFRDAEGILTGMLNLLEDKPLRQALREAGKLSVRKMFNIDLMISKLQAVYDE